MKKNKKTRNTNSSFQERATKISHGNTALHAAENGDKVLGKICAAIAGDEARHERAYQKIMDKLFELDPSGSMCAFSDMMQRQIVMPAHLMDDRSHGKSNASSAAGKAANLFKDFSSVAQATGTYTGESSLLLLFHVLLVSSLPFFFLSAAGVGEGKKREEIRKKNSKPPFSSFHSSPTCLFSKLEKKKKKKQATTTSPSWSS